MAEMKLRQKYYTIVIITNILILPVINIIIIKETNKIESLLCAAQRSKRFPSYKSFRTDCVGCYTPYKTV